MKPPLRTKSVSTKVSEAEFALLEERARGAGMRLGEWVREALLSAPAESGPDSGEVALGEVLALRSLLLNLHFGSATIPEAGSEVEGLASTSRAARKLGDAVWRRRRCRSILPMAKVWTTASGRPSFHPYGKLVQLD
jgi:hypothetical protein